MVNNNTPPEISVIIPALNEEEFIGKCLQSLAQVDHSSISFEVIIIDNGSTDHTCDIARSFADRLVLKVFVLKDVNISALRNFGASEARGDIYAFLDADCSVAEDWLMNAFAYFITPETGAVGSSHLTPDEASWVAKTWDLVVARKRKSGQTDNLPSGNLWVRKKSFDAIKGFNENLQTNEDFDLCFRLSKHGYLLYADPAIKAWHWGVPNSLSAFYRQTRWHGTNVINVFLDNIREHKNVKSILYGLYYFLLLIATPIIFISFHRELFIILLLVAYVLPSGILSYRVAIKNKALRSFPSLVSLFIIYGIARAHSIADNIYLLIRGTVSKIQR